MTDSDKAFTAEEAQAVLIYLQNKYKKGYSESVEKVALELDRKYSFVGLLWYILVPYF